MAVVGFDVAAGAGRCALAAGRLAAVAVLWASGMGRAAPVLGETYFNDEGVAFHAFETPGTRRIELIRLIDREHWHAFTTSTVVMKRLQEEAGAAKEMSGIYCSEIELEGMVKLYEFKRVGDSRTILLVGEEGRKDLLARPSEFTEVPQKAWVYPPEFRGPESAPVHLLRNPFTDVRLYTASEAEIQNLLARRDRRLKRLRGVAAGVISTSLMRVAPVGEAAEFQDLSWRFTYSEALGESLPISETETLTSEQTFVAFDVMVANNGSSVVEIKAPDVILAPDKRASANVKAGAAAPAEYQHAPGMKLAPHERRRFRFIYELPPKAKDVMIEVYSGDPGVAGVMVLDTGR
ncbi:MAG: hypothetical protein C4547_09275 [Phycisphaerales bacterium]|nr:MAG: hypothetical protein C4547_09275 [Phycisphaerales bacterium]